MHLSNQLTGDALKVIEGLEQTATNYSTAIALLTSRFGDPKKIKIEHLKAFTSVFPTLHKPNAKELREFYTQLQINYNSLLSIEHGNDEKVMDMLQVITPSLFFKLPRPIQVQMYSRDPESQSDIAVFKESLRYCVEMQEAIERKDLLEPKSQHQQSANSKFQPQKFSGAALASVSQPPATAPSAQTQQVPAPRRCYFCDGEHFSDECTKITSLRARQDIRQNKNGCPLCLRSLRNHRGAQCNSKNFPCWHCKQTGQHHRSLCPSLFGAATQNRLTVQPNEEPSASEIAQAEATIASLKVQLAAAKNAAENRLTSAEITAKQVLMPIAKIQVKNPVSGKIVTARALFDSGSSETYVSEDLVRRLELDQHDGEERIIKSFGHDPQKMLMYRCNPEFGMKNGEWMEIDASTTPTVMKQVVFPPLPLSEADKKFLNQQKAWDNIAVKAEKANVDIQIGNDYYFDLMEPEIQHLECGPTLVKSRIGWFPSGQITTPIAHFTDSQSALFNVRISHSAVTQSRRKIGPQGTVRYPTELHNGARQQQPKYAATQQSKSMQQPALQLSANSAITTSQHSAVQQLSPTKLPSAAEDTQITTPSAQLDTPQPVQRSYATAASQLLKPQGLTATITQPQPQRPLSQPHSQLIGVLPTTEASPFSNIQQVATQPQNFHYFNFSVSDSPFFWHEDLADFHNFSSTLIFCSSKFCPDFLAKNKMNC